MADRFNPPPQWPPQPPNWTPPPGWQPDPSWPPPPPGWQLWLPDSEPASAAPATLDTHTTQRARRWFSTRPAWAKVLLVLLAIGLLPWLLIIGGLAAAATGVVALRRGSLRSLRLAGRPSATAAVILGLAAAGTGVALAAAVLAPAKQPQPARPSETALATAITATPPAPTTTTPTTTTPATTHPSTHPPAATPSRPASTHASPPPIPATTRPPSLCGAPANPYGYNFCGRGEFVSDPPADICDYFDCIQNFDNGVGHMEECQDLTFSMSGGRPGSCSRHGGNLRPVYGGP